MQYFVICKILLNIGHWDAYVPQYLFLRLNRLFTRKVHFLECYIRNRFHLEASILEEFVALESVNLCSKDLHVGVKTKFSLYQLEDVQATETN